MTFFHENCGRCKDVKRQKGLGVSSMAVVEGGEAGWTRAWSVEALQLANLDLGVAPFRNQTPIWPATRFMLDANHPLPESSQTAC